MRFISSMSHRPHSHAWQEILAFYQELAQKSGWHIEPMIDLVRFIAESPYARSLFPYTSHADLHIGRVSHFASGDGELTIVYDQQAKTFRFTYQQRADDVKPWSTECGAEDGRRKFEQILHKRLRWFHEG